MRNVCTVLYKNMSDETSGAQLVSHGGTMQPQQFCGSHLVSVTDIQGLMNEIFLNLANDGVKNTAFTTGVFILGAEVV